MLLLARLDSSQEILNRKTIRLDELMVECVQRIRNLATNKNISIETTIEEAVEIRADPERLKSALLNLLDNAVKYSNHQSTIAVRLRSKGSSPHKALLVIEDHGCGIALQDIPKIFKRFYRAESARADVPGSGLGLAIAERVVMLHGGTISVQSEMGHGSVFTVELPRD